MSFSFFKTVKCEVEEGSARIRTCRSLPTGKGWVYAVMISFMIIRTKNNPNGIRKDVSADLLVKPEIFCLYADMCDCLITFL